MNHIYRIIFNRASGVFQVVSELAKGKVKSAKTSVKLTALCMALVSGAVLADEPASTSAPAADNTQKELADLKTKYKAQEKTINELKQRLDNMRYFSASNGRLSQGINSNNNGAIGYESIAIGVDATIGLGKDNKQQNQQIAIGKKAKALGDFSMAIGSETTASGYLSTAIGYGSQALGLQSYAFGIQALSQGELSLSLGTGSKSIGARSLSVGVGAQAYGKYGLSLGDFALSRGEDTIAIGRNSEIEDASNYSIAMGNGAYIGKKRSPASGSIHYVDKERDTLVADGKVGETGSRRTKGNDYSIANPEPEKRHKGSIAIGLHAKGYGFQTIAIGGSAEASGADSLSVGIGAESRGLYSSAVGAGAIAYKDYSSAFGHWSAARAENSLALGVNTRINEGVNGGVALGSDSFNYRDLATIGYDISEQATKFEINGNQVKTMLLGEAGKKYQELQDEIKPLKEAYETEHQNYADLAELRNILYDLPKKEAEVNGLKINMEKLKAAAKPNQAEIDNATKSYETAKNELEKMQEKLTALQTKTTIQEKDYDKAKPLIEAKLTETEKKADKAESDLNKKQQEQNKLVATWKGTAGSVSVGNEIRGITRQITGVAAGTADTDAVNLAQLKSAGLRFAVNSDNQGFAGTDKTHNFYKHVGETLSILGESGVGYKADLYSSRNLITYHDNDGIRIAMKTNPVFDRLTLVNKDDPSKSLELYAKTGDDGKAHLIQAEKAPEPNNAAKEKPQTPNNGTDGNYNAAGQDGSVDQDGANGQNGQAGDSGSTGTADSAGSQGSNGTAGQDGSVGQDGANGQNGQAGGTGSTGNSGSTGSQGSNGTAGQDGSVGQDGANGQNGQAGDSGSTGNAGSAGSQGADGTAGHNGSAGQGGANGQNGQAGGSGSTGNTGSAGSQGADGTAGHNGSAGQDGANGQNGQAGGTGSTGNAGSAGSQGSNGAAGQDGANGQNGSNANHGINGNNGSNGLSANETDLTRAAIKGLNQATGEINRQIRKTTRESRAGIAAAMAMGQIYPVQGKRFTVGAAAGTYRGQSAVAVGVRYTPKPNVVISLSGSADTNNGVGAATGVSFGF
ncbi:Collagen triple helix repeat (20 copies) [Haemophilus influenzae]|uniref:ESPR-type extended signal peptide-containing protein n=1 Tax=Haemophilus influenzae TaxID=727 RepID=UPI000D01AFE3|nr:YadA-like family protein [Haemophilus influenzae]PRM14869.1 Collagen triple helix repeat (20 copies) [Haemophilus influenzae]